jgi:hypothetical protein
MKRIILILVALLMISSFAQAIEAPNLKGTSMTIPWEDFKKILDQLQEAKPQVEPAPPVDYAIGRGALTGKLNNGKLELEAEYPISVLKKGWVKIFLVPNTTPLANILLNGKSAAVTDTGSGIELIVKGPATHSLKMRFELNAPVRPGPGSVGIQLPPAAGQVMMLRSGEKFRDIHIDGATMTPKGAGAYSAILQNDYLKINYTVAMEKKEQEAIEKLPPKLLVENSTLISIDEGFIRAIVHLSYEVRHAAVDQFSLKIPEGFDVADCHGASLAGWKFEKETGLLRATVGFEVKGKYNLTLVLERSTKEESFTFSLPSITAQNVERERGFFAVQVTGGVEVTPAGAIEGLQLVDAKELPPVLRGGATNPIVLSFKYLHHPFKSDLRVIRHKTQAVLGAAIDSANYVMQVTEDGDCVMRVIYTVRNNKKQFLELTLPDNEKTALWSSFVADKPVKPSQTKESKILLPLEKSGYEGNELRSFNVEIIYYTNLGNKLRALGFIELLMPQVDLPISQSMLTIYSPKRYRYERVAGSLRAEYITPRRPSMDLGLLTAVAEDVEYRGKGEILEGKKALLGKLGNARVSDSTVMKQQKMAEEVFQTRIRAAQQAQSATGSLPARFSVPQEGSVLRYRELITIGEPSTLKLFYSSRKITGILDLIALILTVCLAWFATRLLCAEGLARRGREKFASVSVGIFVLAALGASVGYIVFGAFIGLGSRFVRWCYLQVMDHLNKR